MSAANNRNNMGKTGFDTTHWLMLAVCAFMVFYIVYFYLQDKEVPEERVYKLAAQEFISHPDQQEAKALIQRVLGQYQLEPTEQNAAGVIKIMIGQRIKHGMPEMDNLGCVSSQAKNRIGMEQILADAISCAMAHDADVPELASEPAPEQVPWAQVAPD